jgi:hypothetical protein
MSIEKRYSVTLWGSNPDETDNDDCWTGTTSRPRTRPSRRTARPACSQRLGSPSTASTGSSS